MKWERLIYSLMYSIFRTLNYDLGLNKHCLESVLKTNIY